MTIRQIAITLRAKKLGVLIRDARLSAGKSAEESATLLGITPAEYAAYELGESSPSLPELELLAYFLKVPLEHFWGQAIKTDESVAAAGIQREPLFALRQRMIGAQIRQARLEAGLSPESLAEQVGLPPEQIKEVELGEKSVPLPVLEALANTLNRSIKEFQDQHGPLGIRASRARSVEEFQKLPPDLQAFVSKPVNRPYLELAQRLSEMSVDKLRAVAEGLLEITL
jgi:transcriptional regulator with XRE-family HTH domain